MRTGTIGGFLAGTALSALVLGGASILTYQPPVPQSGPDATAVNVPAGSEFRQSREDTEASLPVADNVPDPAEEQKIEAPEPDDIVSLDEATSAPAAQPTLGSADTDLSAPDTPDAPSGVDLDAEQPVLASPQTLAPQAPSDENDLSISTDPSQPVLPEITDGSAFEEEVQAALVPETVTAPDVQTDAAPETETVTVPEVEADTVPEVETDVTETAQGSEDGLLEDAMPEVVTEPEPQAEPQEDTAPVVDTEVTEAAPVEDGEPEETLTEEKPAEETPTEEKLTEDAPPEEPLPVEKLPQVVTQPTPEDDSELASQPEPALQNQTETAGTIGNLADGVTVGRLPSVTAPDPADEAPETEPAAEEVPDEEQRPLDLFSAEFDNPDGKPLMSFVLLDEGNNPISFDALADFPYPISFAVDVTWDGAQAAMSRYRKAGLEVLAMVDLPDSASAVDTEVAMQTYLSALPETVAVMEGVRTGLQSNRAATEQLIPILQESGHGLVLFSEGFDTAQKLISREGVPALSVFRDIDSNDQSASVIRRFLDQAAFRAGQEETGVIVVGRLRAETVSALLLWGLQDRANSVAIAPVSALLKAQVADQVE